MRRTRRRNGTLAPSAPAALDATAVLWSAALTGFAFLILGALKARVVDQPAWRSALETLAVGGGAAVLAYVLGAALRGVA